jgi:hypothetical protein
VLGTVHGIPGSFNKAGEDEELQVLRAMTSVKGHAVAGVQRACITLLVWWLIVWAARAPPAMLMVLEVPTCAMNA